MFIITKVHKEKNNSDTWQIEVITLINKDLKNKHFSFIPIFWHNKVVTHFDKWRLSHFDTKLLILFITKKNSRGNPSIHCLCLDPKFTTGCIFTRTDFHYKAHFQPLLVKILLAKIISLKVYIFFIYFLRASN